VAYQNSGEISNVNRMEMVMRKFFAFVSVCLAFAIGSAWAAGSGPVGSWNITAETPQGKMEEVLMIKGSGDAYSGQMQAPQGKQDLKNIMVHGDEVMFVREINTPNGNMTLNYSAKVDGDKIMGTAKSDFGEVPFSGTRE
jgi:hypothetical protein